MWKWIQLIVCVALISLGAEEVERPIVIVIPSYNNAQWYRYNLGSVFIQNYQNYRVIYLDDHSPDGTGQLVEEFIRENHQQDRVTLIRNEQRVGALANTYRGVWACKPEEIVIILDGDDWFAHERVCERINRAYADPDVWMTYGQFCYYPGGSMGWARAVPDSVIAANGIRSYDWVTTHLRSFYAGLFQKIDVQDLMYGDWFFTTTGDLAYTYPMIEMAGVHSRFIPDLLYVYNFATPINDQKVNADLQLYYTYLLRARPPYTPIESLFKN